MIEKIWLALLALFVFTIGLLVLVLNEEASQQQPIQPPATINVVNDQYEIAPPPDEFPQAPEYSERYTENFWEEQDRLEERRDRTFIR